MIFPAACLGFIGLALIVADIYATQATTRLAIASLMWLGVGALYALLALLILAAAALVGMYP